MHKTLSMLPPPPCLAVRTVFCRVRTWTLAPASVEGQVAPSLSRIMMKRFSRRCLTRPCGQLCLNVMLLLGSLHCGYWWCSIWNWVRSRTLQVNDPRLLTLHTNPPPTKHNKVGLGNKSVASYITIDMWSIAIEWSIISRTAQDSEGCRQMTDFSGSTLTKLGGWHRLTQPMVT